MIELKSRLQRCLDITLRFAADWRIQIKSVQNLGNCLSPSFKKNADSTSLAGAYSVLVGCFR